MALRQAMTLTDAAADRIRSLLAKRGRPAVGIRVGVRCIGRPRCAKTCGVSEWVGPPRSLGAPIGRPGGSVGPAAVGSADMTAV